MCLLLFCLERKGFGCFFFAFWKKWTALRTPHIAQRTLSNKNNNKTNHSDRNDDDDNNNNSSSSSDKIINSNNSNNDNNKNKMKI
jgi:hypothetical protein